MRQEKGGDSGGQWSVYACGLFREITLGLVVDGNLWRVEGKLSNIALTALGTIRTRERNKPNPLSDRANSSRGFKERTRRVIARISIARDATKATHQTQRLLRNN